MNTVLLLLMGISGVLTLVLLKKKHQTAAGVCAVLVVILAAAKTFTTPQPGEESVQFVQRDRQVMVSVLAQTVAERHAGKRVALLVAPDIGGFPGGALGHLATEGLLTEALRENGLTVEVVPLSLTRAQREQIQAVKAAGEDLPPEETYSTLIMDLSMGIDVSRLNAILRDLKDRADVVVCTLRMSPTFAAKKLPAAGNAPDLVLMHPGAADIDTALRSTVLDVVLRYRPDATWITDRALPEDDRQAFDLRYELATRN